MKSLDNRREKINNEPTTWQERAIRQLSQHFRQTAEAQAFVLTGSLAAEDGPADVWSDVDAKIILAEEAVARYYASTAWLAPFGRIIGLERHEHPLTKTLRVFLADFRRFDLTFIAAESLQTPDVWDHNPMPPPYAILWSRRPELKARIAALPAPAAYQDPPAKQIAAMADAFYFKAAMAITKVVRNDWLIGAHLALDLAQDALVLQMIRRDRAKRTTVHRTGGWGNEIVERVAWGDWQSAGDGILALIQRSCEIFDELAADLDPTYTPRAPFLTPTLAAARDAIKSTYPKEKPR